MVALGVMGRVAETWGFSCLVGLLLPMCLFSWLQFSVEVFHCVWKCEIQVLFLRGGSVDLTFRAKWNTC